MIVHLPEGSFLVNASTDEVSIPGLLVSAFIVHCSGAMSELPPYRRAADMLAEICGDQARHHLVPFPKSYRRAADTPVRYISCDEYARSQCFYCRDGCWSFVSAGHRYSSGLLSSHLESHVLSADTDPASADRASSPKLDRQLIPGPIRQ